MIRSALVSISLLLTTLAQASPNSCSSEIFLNNDNPHFVLNVTNKMLANISPEGAAEGAVVASPSGKDWDHDVPHYWYHWVRDAALVLNATFNIMQTPLGQGIRSLAEKDIWAWINFSRQNQEQHTLSPWLGEPKFEVDGRPYMGGWGRPQSDGPALRALTATRFLKMKLDEGQGEALLTKLYDGKIPTDSLIKRDLEYVAHHWREPTFDVWEEKLGVHFYTLNVQRASLLEGAELADRLGDHGAATFYREQAGEIETKQNSFWSNEHQSLFTTVDFQSGLSHTPIGANLDVAVILGALHGSGDVTSFGPSDDRILSTAFQLEHRFKTEFEINRNPQFKELGTAIGRYPLDTYDGYDTNKKGNPWFLATNAYAELCSRVRNTARFRGELRITNMNRPFFNSLHSFENLPFPKAEVLRLGTPEFELVMNALTDQAARFRARTMYHWNLNQMSEQFNRDTGIMQGARDLTWSYASFVTAVLADLNLLKY